MPVLASTVPGSETPAPTGVSPSASHSASAAAASSASASKTERGSALAVVVPDRPVESDRAAQVADADGQVVDVDLEPERGDAAVVELEDLGRAPDATPVGDTRLAHDAALDELGHEARDRRLVEPGQLCELRS